jgi:hypothetical protein
VSVDELVLLLVWTKENISVISEEGEEFQCRRGGAAWSALTGFRGFRPQQW